MSHLEIGYWVSLALGFIYIVGSAMLGHLHEGDHGEIHVHHDNYNDSGDPGDINHSGSSDDPGDIDVSHGSKLGLSSKMSSQEQLGASNLNKHRFSRSESFYFRLVSLLSPTKLALTVFFTGAIGLLSLRMLPQLGAITLVPALLIGYGLARIILNLLNAFSSKLHASTNFRQDSLIGSSGQLTLSIEPGKTGEVIISGRSGRHSAPAKSSNPDLQINKLSKVIVVDCKDGVFYVEPVLEELN